MATILVVDDTILTLRLLEVMLRRMNHIPISVFSGIEALASLQKNKVDLIITDINMPEMDGLKLLEEIKADEKLRDIPVIVMTAGHQPSLPITAKEKGATFYMAQPFSSGELAEAVNTCLDKISID